MKKLIVLGVVALVAMFAASFAQADTMSTNKNVHVEVGVNEVFGFAIWDQELSQTFTKSPGEAAIGDIHITASSNHTVPWKIMASSSGMVGTYHAGVLPIKMTTITGSGTKVTDLVVSGTAQTIYTAGIDEYPKSGVTVDGLFVVPISTDTAQDLYTGDIQLTMTE